MHPFKIDAQGALYVDLGSATNACQRQNRIPNSPGIQPCTELETRAGIWRYDANRTGQQFSPAERFATGLRNGEGIAFDLRRQDVRDPARAGPAARELERALHRRAGRKRTGGRAVQLERGADFGWPYCYFDLSQQKRVLAPEYGGDGKAIGPCAGKRAPVAAFPAQWAPNDLAIDDGQQFRRLTARRVIAFHGSWMARPAPQGGADVVPSRSPTARRRVTTWCPPTVRRASKPARRASTVGIGGGADGALDVSTISADASAHRRVRARQREEGNRAGPVSAGQRSDGAGGAGPRA